MGGYGPCLQRVQAAEKALEVRDGALEPAAAAVVGRDSATVAERV